MVLIERVIFFIHRVLIEAKNTLASNKEKVGFKRNADCTATKRTVVALKDRENKAGIQHYKNGCHACTYMYKVKLKKLLSCIKIIHLLLTVSKLFF